MSSLHVWNEARKAFMTGIMEGKMTYDCYILTTSALNTLRPRQNGRHLPDDIFKCIFLNENVWISLKISLKFVPRVPINNIPALVLIMAWHRPGDKLLSEPMMVSLLTHICVTRLQWVKIYILNHFKSGTDMLSMLEANNAVKEAGIVDGVLIIIHSIWRSFCVDAHFPQ